MTISASEKLLTVVIPAWDLADGLTQAVDSAVAQGDRVQVLVVDNASIADLPPTPGAERIRLDERVPLGRARNVGLRSVSTPYVLFLDADDALLPGAVERLVTDLERRPKHVMAVAVALSVDAATGERLPARSFPPRIAFVLAACPRVLAIANLIRNMVPVTGSVAIRVAAARSAGGFAELRVGQDWVLGAALAFRGGVGFSEVPGSVYSVRQDSITSSGSWSDFVAVRREVRRRVRNDKMTPTWARLLLPAIGVAQMGFALRRLAYGRSRGRVRVGSARRPR